MQDESSVISKKNNETIINQTKPAEKTTRELVHEKGEAITLQNSEDESSLNTDRKEFLPDAKPEQQLTACYDTLQNILAEGCPQETQNILIKYINLIKKSYLDKTLNNNRELAERIVKTTTVLLDLFVANNIGTVVKPGKSNYLRQGYMGSAGELPLPQIPKDVLAKYGYDNPDEFKNPYFMTSEEFSIFQDKTPWAKDLEFMSFDEIQTRLNSFDGTNEWPPKIFRLNDQYVGILSSVRYDENNKDAMGKIKLIRESLHPLSEIPRQEIWLAFLKKGKAIFSRDHKYEPINIPNDINENPMSTQVLLTEEKEFWDLTQSSANKESKRKAIQARKGKLWVENETERILQLVENHKKHFARVLGREHSLFGQPEVILTRSGISANGAVIEAIKEYYQNNPSIPAPIAYRMPGFFFENFKDIDEKFNTSTDNREKATVFFINFAPGVSGIDFPNGYAAEREKVIAEIKIKAAENPNTPYFLVFDKTYDPLYSTFQSDETLPSNLNIFETASLTKHQRGGQNYFFGSAVYWGDNNLCPLLDNAVITKRGTLTSLNIMNMPLLTATEIQTNIDYVQRLGFEAEKELDELQKDIPENQRWHFDNYNYFGYLIPPAHYDPNTDLGRAFIEIANEKKDGDFVEGSSFGLNMTVLTSYESFSDPTAQILRVSYGLNTTPEKIRSFIRKGIEDVRNKAKEKESKVRYEEYFNAQRSQLKSTFDAAYKTRYGQHYLEPLNIDPDTLTYDEFARTVPIVQQTQVQEDSLQFFTGDMNEMVIESSGGTTGKKKVFYRSKEENFVQFENELAEALRKSTNPSILHGNWDSGELFAITTGSRMIRPDTEVVLYSNPTEGVKCILDHDMILFSSDISSFRMFLSDLDAMLEKDPKLIVALKDKQLFVDLNSEPVTIEELNKWHARLRDIFGKEPGFSVSYSQSDTGNLGLYIYHPGDTKDNFKYKMFNDRLVEVVDNEGKLVFGKKGNLVVTTLRKDGSIFLRYDTGDQGIMDISDNGTIYLGEVGRNPEAGMVSIWGEKIFFQELYKEFIDASPIPFKMEIQVTTTPDSRHKKLSVNVYGKSFDESDSGQSFKETVEQLIRSKITSNESVKTLNEKGMLDIAINFGQDTPVDLWKGWRKLPDQIQAN